MFNNNSRVVLFFSTAAMAVRYDAVGTPMAIDVVDDMYLADIIDACLLE